MVYKSCRRIAAVTLCVALGACGGIDPSSVQDISAWGLGWQFKALQNRVQPAIPPVVRFLRARYPGRAVAAAEPSDALARNVRAVLSAAEEPRRQRLRQRLIGVFTVSGLPCAAEGFAVRDGATPVAAFVVLDVSVDRLPPSSWQPCNGEIVSRDPDNALKILIFNAVEGALERP